jgi:hypothetical protein
VDEPRNAALWWPNFTGVVVIGQGSRDDKAIPASKNTITDVSWCATDQQIQEYASSSFGTPSGGVGTTGATGPMGPAGVAGPAGTPGANGAIGSTGATGPAGPQGVIGLTGAQGNIGATGATGAPGTNGLPGGPGPVYRVTGSGTGYPLLSITSPAAGNYVVVADVSVTFGNGFTGAAQPYGAQCSVNSGPMFTSAALGPSSGYVSHGLLTNNISLVQAITTSGGSIVVACTPTNSGVSATAWTGSLVAIPVGGIQ